MIQHFCSFLNTKFEKNWGVTIQFPSLRESGGWSFHLVGLRSPSASRTSVRHTPKVVCLTAVRRIFGALRRLCVKRSILRFRWVELYCNYYMEDYQLNIYNIVYVGSFIKDNSFIYPRQVSVPVSFGDRVLLSRVRGDTGGDGAA